MQNRLRSKEAQVDKGEVNELKRQEERKRSSASGLLRNTALVGIFLGSGLVTTMNAQKIRPTVLLASSGPSATEMTLNSTVVTEPITSRAPPQWKFQAGISLARSTKRISYNITTDDRLDMGGYIVSGVLMPDGKAVYWPQIGLVHNWPKEDGTIAEGYMIIYDSPGEIGRTGSTLVDINGMLVKGKRPDIQIAGGHKINICLSIDTSRDKVVAEVTDLTTNWPHPLRLEAPAHGATEFVGNPDTAFPAPGRASGAMIEVHSANPVSRVGISPRFDPADKNIAYSGPWGFVKSHNIATGEEKTNLYSQPGLDQIKAGGVTETLLSNGSVLIE